MRGCPAGSAFRPPRMSGLPGPGARAGDERDPRRASGAHRRGSGAEQVEKRARSDDLDARVLAEVEKSPIASDDVTCSSLESRTEVLVVVGVVADSGQLPVRNDVGQDDDVLEPELRIGAAEKLAHFPIAERAQHFVHDGRREHELEICLAQEPFDEAARCACGLDDRADVDVCVEDRAEQWLLSPAPRLQRRLASRALRLQSDLESLVLTHRVLLLLFEELQGMSPCEPAHLLESLDRH